MVPEVFARVAGVSSMSQRSRRIQDIPSWFWRSPLSSGGLVVGPAVSSGSQRFSQGIFEVPSWFLPGGLAGSQSSSRGF